MRKDKGQPVKVGKGRKPLIDAARLAELKEHVSVKDMSGDSVKKKQLKTIVGAEINQGRSKTLRPAAEDPSGEEDIFFSEDDKSLLLSRLPKADSKTISKYMREIAPDEVQNASSQAERRREATCDLWSHVSAAVVLSVAMEGVTPSMKFTTDEWTKRCTPTSETKGGRAKAKDTSTICLAAGSREKLRAKGVTPKFTPVRLEEEGVHVYAHNHFTGAADGTWLPPMTVFKEKEGQDNFRGAQLYKVYICLPCA